MSHIGWMINVTKILPELSLSNHDYYGILFRQFFYIIIVIFTKIKFQPFL
jgi:hypothetical protein